MAKNANQRKEAQLNREREAGRWPVSLSLPLSLVAWLDTQAKARGESRKSRIEAILTESQAAASLPSAPGRDGSA